MNPKTEFKTTMKAELIGTLDELSAWIGFVKETLIFHASKKFLIMVQMDLSILMSKIYCEDSSLDINCNVLDNSISEINKTTTEFKFFNEHNQINICRTVCRRAERLMIKYTGKEHEYLNKLSKYLFLLQAKYNEQ